MKSIFKKKIGKKAQAQSIIVFFMLCVGVLIASIVIFKLATSIIIPFQAQIGNMSAPAGEAVGYVYHQMATWWDYAIILVLGLNVLILFVSSFYIDVHPAFAIIYIIAIFFMFIFGNYALGALDAVWNAMGTGLESSTQLQQFIINHFQLLMLGIVILSGVIMYAKYKIAPNTGLGGNY